MSVPQIDSKDILVIDGTVLAGLLILVSLIPRELQNVGLPEAFLTGAAFAIILFSISAVLAIFSKLTASKVSATTGFAVLIIVMVILIWVIRLGFELKALDSNSTSVTPNSSLDVLTLVALILSIIAVIPLGIFFVSRQRYSPKVQFKFPLDKEGDTHIIPIGQQDIFFSLHGSGSKDIIIEWVKVCSNPFDVNIMPSRACGFPQVMTAYNDERFFRALEFRPDERVLFVGTGRMVGYAFSYGQSRQDRPLKEFELKFVARTRIDKAKIPFPLDMFGAKEVDHEELVKFKIADSK